MTVNTNIMVVIVAGLALCAWVYNASPETAAVQIPPLLVGIGVLIRQFITDTKVEKVDAKVETVAAVSAEAKVAAVESVAASKENAQTLAVTAVQTAQALEQQAQSIGVVSDKQDTTNHMVDGQLSAILKEQKELRNQVAALMQERAVNEVKLDYAVDSEARIISAIAAVVPAPSTGTTTPLGTLIDGGTPVEGATIITVDPPEAATITSVPPKGKRPKVGDDQ